jgi:branched-chain amino acid transport system permease protein
VRSPPGSVSASSRGSPRSFYPEASNTVIFVIMVIVLLIKPAGLFGKER